MTNVERLVPVPGWSPTGFTIFSEIRASQYPPRALYDAFKTGRVPSIDLPAIIASIWVWDDSPTSALGEKEWLEMFRSAGFFAYPPLVVRQADGSHVPLERPTAPLTLYRGASPNRMRRMSWSGARHRAVELGMRHAPDGSAMLYRVTVEPSAILAYLGERANTEVWTVVVDPAGLQGIVTVEDISSSQTQPAS
jgi:hypothetical protein